jgi:hypothetical protein
MICLNENRRGSVLIYGLMLGLVIIVLALALAPSVVQFSSDARNVSYENIYENSSEYLTVVGAINPSGANGIYTFNETSGNYEKDYYYILTLYNEEELVYNHYIRNGTLLSYFEYFEYTNSPNSIPTGTYERVEIPYQGIVIVTNNITAPLRYGLDCSNSSISSFDKATCYVVDLNIFYFIAGLIFIGGAFVTSKIIFS